MLTKFPAFYIFGANTNLGKTIFSAGLCKIATERLIKTNYIKPIQTGYPKDCDASFVKKIVRSELLKIETFAAFADPISPHRVLKNTDKEAYNDEKIISLLQERIEFTDAQFTLIEGAGGVASPSLDSNLQCDLYRQILLPIVFIADSQLGGISSTITAIEFAQSRGFEIACIFLFEGENENSVFLQKYFYKKIPVISFSNLLKDRDIQNWYTVEQENFTKAYSLLRSFHKNKIEYVNGCIETARENIWWPFTQHQKVQEIKYIDSALNDEYSCYLKEYEKGNIHSKNIYDASASWWTQGIGHASTALVKAASYAAGRYGHVMFPGNIHEPAAKLTSKLLNTVGKGWAKRVFFSDNGSTANEVAIKMAFRKSFGKEKNMLNPIILGLKDSYHGDTHATMDATNPNVFKNADHWYNPRGYWLSYPKCFMKNKEYFARIPSEIFKSSGEFSISSRESSISSRESSISSGDSGMSSRGLTAGTSKISVNNNTEFIDIKLDVENIDQVFSAERLNSQLYNYYLFFIQNHFQIIKSLNYNIGACMLEGVVMGSGGMQFVDPLFQKILITECQKRGIPVILDEVFTGFWRLGKISAAELLNVKPDIACYGKLLTGGLIPMAVTLATEDIFNEFLHEKLEYALLHGHSYTATAVGCAVSYEAISEILNCLHFNKDKNELNNIWDVEYVRKISELSNIERVFSLGSLFAFELKTKKSDYASTRSKYIINILQNNRIDARPLGNVVYVMAGFNSKPEYINKILKFIFDSLCQETTIERI